MHSHANESHQIGSGLYDAMIVRDAGAPARPLNEVVILFGGDNDHGRINHRSVVAPVEMTAGRRYRLRLVNINTDRRIVFSLLSDSGLLAWRAVAKDGADLPANQATARPATLLTGPGETADFEFTATAAPGLRLEATTHIAPMWQVRVPIHVRPSGSTGDAAPPPEVRSIGKRSFGTPDLISIRRRLLNEPRYVFRSRCATNAAGG